MTLSSLSCEESGKCKENGFGEELRQIKWASAYAAFGRSGETGVDEGVVVEGTCRIEED